MAEMELNFCPAVCPDCEHLSVYATDDRTRIYDGGIKGPNYWYDGKVKLGCKHFKMCYKMKEMGVN